MKILVAKTGKTIQNDPRRLRDNRVSQVRANNNTRASIQICSAYA